MMTAVLPVVPQQGDSRFSPLPLRPESPQGRPPSRRGAYQKSRTRSLPANEGGAPLSAKPAPAVSSSLDGPTASPLPASVNAPPPNFLSPFHNTIPTEHDDMEFPAFDLGCSFEGSEQSSQDSSTTSSPPEDSPSENQLPAGFAGMPRIAGDDNSIEREPTQHVDYLSHDWKEEDIWTSWRYVVTRKNACSNSTRLENAAWRSWAKSRCHLPTVAPESLNWHKDCDVTWLYGPLQTHLPQDESSDTSSPPPSLSGSNSNADKKSILKKRTISETILQHSLSTRSLLSQAGEIIKARHANPYGQRRGLERPSSDFAISHHHREGNALRASADSLPDIRSGSPTPTHRRHISFNTEVSQCIAVDDDVHAEYGSPRPRYFPYYEEDWLLEDDTSSDDSLVMMGHAPSRSSSSSRSTPRSSFSSESRTIAPLPSTTLKFRPDSPEVEKRDAFRSQFSWWDSGPESNLSRSSSAETLRPPTRSKSPTNFLLDDEEIDMTNDAVSPEWEFGETAAAFDSSWFPDRKSESPKPRQSPYPTSSGVFVPFGYDDEGHVRDDHEPEDYPLDYGLFGKVINTVNTARDIAHVIWNVGWGY